MEFFSVDFFPAVVVLWYLFWFHFGQVPSRHSHRIIAFQSNFFGFSLYVTGRDVNKWKNDWKCRRNKRRTSELPSSVSFLLQEVTERILYTSCIQKRSPEPSFVLKMVIMRWSKLGSLHDARRIVFFSWNPAMKAQQTAWPEFALSRNTVSAFQYQQLTVNLPSSATMNLIFCIFKMGLIINVISELLWDSEIHVWKIYSNSSGWHMAYIQYM